MRKLIAVVALLCGASVSAASADEIGLPNQVGREAYENDAMRRQWVGYDVENKDDAMRRQWIGYTQTEAASAKWCTGTGEGSAPTAVIVDTGKELILRTPGQEDAYIDESWVPARITPRSSETEEGDVDTGLATDVWIVDDRVFWPCDKSE